MDPNSNHVIDEGGLSIDMALYNTPRNREIIEEQTSSDMLALLMKQHGYTYQEALTKQLYHVARMDEKYGHRDGYTLEVDRD